MSLAETVSHELKLDTLFFAHSHNDYENPRPLLDALDRTFGSVEADIYLVSDELLVAHDLEDTSPSRTLENLYLQPLTEWIEAHGGSVYGDNGPFWLMIDIKSGGSNTYRVLHSQLKGYKEILTDFSHPIDLNARPVSVVISGNRDEKLIASLKPRLAAYDGRVSDIFPDNQIGSNTPSDSQPYIAWISDNWKNHFRWNGDTEFPKSESDKLLKIAEATHAIGAKLRFWNIPDKPEVWETLHNHGVDLINTDRLGAFEKHFADNIKRNNQ